MPTDGQVFVTHTPKDQESTLIPLVWIEKHQTEHANFQ